MSKENGVLEYIKLFTYWIQGDRDHFLSVFSALNFGDIAPGLRSLETSFDGAAASIASSSLAASILQNRMLVQLGIIPNVPIDMANLAMSAWRSAWESLIAGTVAGYEVALYNNIDDSEKALFDNLDMIRDGEGNILCECCKEPVSATDDDGEFCASCMMCWRCHDLAKLIRPLMVCMLCDLDETKVVSANIIGQLADGNLKYNFVDLKGDTVDEKAASLISAIRFLIDTGSWSKVLDVTRKESEEDDDFKPASDENKTPPDWFMGFSFDADLT